MTAQDLKNSILQLAIQGKLVEQRKEEGTAEELYKQIQEEKQKLIKENKIKKSKPLPEITDEEIPFDIPDSWKWIKLGMLCTLAKGKKVNNEKLPYLEAKYLRGNKDALIKNSGQLVNKNQYIILVDGQNSGEVFITKEKGILGSTFKILKFSNYIFNQYLLNILIFFKTTLINNKKGAAIPHLNKELFNNILIGLPPLEEQKRIVEKIEELMPYIDKYDKVYNELTMLNNSFPKDIEKSILQYAIQGKLVEQREEEGTAEELYKLIQEKKQKLIKEKKIKKSKPLPEITEEEIHFDIPDSWKWVRLGDISHNWGQKKPNTIFDYVDVGSVDNIIGTLNKNENLINPAKAPSRARKIIKKGTVIYSTVRPYLLNICIIDRDFNHEPIASTAFAILHPFVGIYNKYLYYILKSTMFTSYVNSTMKGVAYPAINEKNLLSGILPIPPLSEQKRIVEKIEELMKYTKKLN